VGDEDVLDVDLAHQLVQQDQLPRPRRGKQILEVLGEKVMTDGQVVNVVLAPLSPESTLEAVPGERDERQAEAEWSPVDELLAQPHTAGPGERRLNTEPVPLPLSPRPRLLLAARVMTWDRVRLLLERVLRGGEALEDRLVQDP
jgi:hypothetical protein